MEKKIAMNNVKKEIDNVAATGVSRSQAIRIVEKNLYDDLPESNNEMLSLFEKRVASQDCVCYSVATLWIKRRKTLHEMKYLPLFETWLYRYVDDWGTCDALCNRVLNFIVEKNKTYFKAVKKWGESDKPFVRRASAVSLIREEKNFIV